MKCLIKWLSSFYAVLITGTKHPRLFVYMGQSVTLCCSKQGVSVLYLRFTSTASPGPAWRVTARFGRLLRSTIVFSEQKRHIHMSSCEIIPTEHCINNAGKIEPARDHALSLDF